MGSRTSRTGRREVLRALVGSVGAMLTCYVPLGVSGTLSGARNKLNEVINVKDFGVVGDGAADDTNAIDSVLNYLARVGGGKLFLSSGIYKRTSTLHIPSNVNIVGEGVSSVIFGSTITGNLVQFGDGKVSTYYASLQGVSLGGVAGCAFSANQAIDCYIRDVSIVGAFTDGVVFNYTWSSEYNNISTNGSNITNACFLFLLEVNACTFNNLYTSTFARYNFLIDGTGHGNTMNTPTAQGGRFGFYMKNTGGFGGWTINSLYTENTARPVVMGVRGNPTIGSPCGVIFNAPTLAGPDFTHPYYSECLAAIEINAAAGVNINAPMFIGLSRSSKGFSVVKVTGDGGSGALAWARVKPTGEIHSIVPLTFGTGYKSASVILLGGKVNATATANIVGGKITSYSLLTPGAGYKRTQTPTGIIFDRASNIKISGASGMGLPVLGINVPFYPFILPWSGSVGSNNSTFAIDDVSVLNGSIGVSARVVRCGTGGALKLAVEEYDDSNIPNVNLFSLVPYP